VDDVPSAKLVPPLASAWPRAVKFCVARYHVNIADAEDTVQSACLSALRGKPFDINAGVSFFTWFFAIVKHRRWHEVRDVARLRKRYAECVPPVVMRVSAQSAAVAIAVRSAVATDPDSELLSSIYVEGYTIAEVARKFGWDVQDTYYRLRKAHRRLRAKLE
jgi:DNA-directed RNA polymerase specialized sigma24 family protein